MRYLVFFLHVDVNSRDTTQQQSAFMWLPASSEETRKLSTWLPYSKTIMTVRELGRESMPGGK